MTTDLMTTERAHRRRRIAALGATIGLVASLASGAAAAPASAVPRDGRRFGWR